MSGPIVRKYGFPNHDKIFGSRPLEHGVDNDSDVPEVQSEDEKPAKAKANPKAKKSETTKKA